MSKNTDLGNLVNGLYVDSTGKVGVGTQSPSTYGYFVVNNSVASSGVSTVIRNFTDTGGNNTRYAGLDFIVGSDNSTASIRTYRTNSASDYSNAITFLTKGSGAGATTPTERMRITSTGRVEVGSGQIFGGNAASDYGSLTLYGGYGVSTSLGSRIEIRGYEDGSSNQGAIISYTNNLERMRITAGGQVGIGASTNPTYLLEVSTAGGSQRIRVGTLQNNNNSSTFEAITTSTNTTASAAFFRANAGGTATIGVSTYNKSGGDSGNFANLSSQANTVAIQIAGNGDVMVKTETSLDALTVNGGVRTTGTGSGNFFGDRSSSNFFGWYAQGGQPYFFNGAVGNLASINVNNGTYTALSDINKKKDFEESNIGLNEILQLKPTLYRMKTEDESSPKELGFIAQEVKEFIPQAYSESGEGEDKFIGLNQMPLIAALTKAIQELKAEIDILKNK